VAPPLNFRKPEDIEHNITSNRTDDALRQIFRRRSNSLHSTNCSERIKKIMIPNQGKLILTQQTQFALNTFHNRADVRNINRLAIDL